MAETQRVTLFLEWFKAEYLKIRGVPYVPDSRGFDRRNAPVLLEAYPDNERLKELCRWYISYEPGPKDPMYRDDPGVNSFALHANWCQMKMRSHTPENPIHKPWKGYDDEKAPTVEQIKARRGAQSFAKEMIEALEGYKEARAAGVSHEDAKKGLELVLREAWPRQDRQWRYDCDVCRDTGLMPHTAPEGIYGGEPHRRVEPCQCKHGLPMRMGWQTKAERLAAKAES